jgi:hypothetical protein
VVAQAARTVDPVVRDTRGDGFGEGALNSIKNRIPGLSQSLPARRDVWGAPLKREGVGPNMVSPFPSSAARNDPLANEMLRVGAKIGVLPRKAGGRDLTPQEYSDYAAAAGEGTRSALLPLITSLEYRTASPVDRLKMIDKAKDAARKAAREKVFGAGPAASPPPRGFVIEPPPTGFVLDR